jgi:hypothetical protein
VSRAFAVLTLFHSPEDQKNLIRRDRPLQAQGRKPPRRVAPRNGKAELISILHIPSPLAITQG